MSDTPHPGYSRWIAAPGTRVIVRADVEHSLRDIMAGPSGLTLYEWAAAHPERRALRGRLPAYAVPLPRSDVRVVVRHNHHGGLLAKWRGDRFLRPRALYELSTSFYLSRSGVPTPEVVACAIYRVNALERRSDVATRELPPGSDLGALVERGTFAPAMLDAVASLLRKLGGMGAWHPDLSVGNVYVTEGDYPLAYVLDVDRVRFGAPDLAGRANASRLARSVRKVAAALGGRDVTSVLAAVAWAP